MNFQLTEEHLAVQEAARDFAQTELLPGVIERDTEAKFPTEQIKKMGDLKNVMNMIPGMGKMAKDIDINDGAFKKVEAVIQSMTPKERMNPDLINTSRKNRIALGCGQNISDINAFIKQFDQMRKMMQKTAPAAPMAQ